MRPLNLIALCALATAICGSPHSVQARNADALVVTSTTDHNIVGSGRVPFDTKTLDTNNVGILIQDEVVVSRSGRYSVHVDLSIFNDSGLDDGFQVQIRVNGNTVQDRVADIAAILLSDVIVSLTHVGTLNAGDRVSVHIEGAEDLRVQNVEVPRSKMSIVRHETIVDVETTQCADLLVVRSDADQGIVGSADVNFTQEVLDTDNVGSIANGDVTIADDGLYEIHANLCLSNTSLTDDQIRVQLRVNGTTVQERHVGLRAIIVNDVPVALVHIRSLSSGDVVSVVIEDAAGVNVLNTATTMRSGLSFIRHNCATNEDGPAAMTVARDAARDLNATGSADFNLEIDNAQAIGQLANGGVTVASAGLYAVFVNLNLTNFAGNYGELQTLLRNNGNTIASQVYDIGDTTTDSLALSLQYLGEFADGDTIDVVIEGGTNLRINNSAAGLNSQMSILRISVDECAVSSLLNHIGVRDPGAVLPFPLSQSPLSRSVLLTQLRSRRDNVLRKSSFGKRIVALYYEHSPEITKILVRDPLALHRTMKLVATLGSPMPAEPGTLHMRRTDYAEGLALLRLVRERGSERLRQACDEITRNIIVTRVAGSASDDVAIHTVSKPDADQAAD